MRSAAWQSFRNCVDFSHWAAPSLMMTREQFFDTTHYVCYDWTWARGAMAT
ncbi:hypothetical protein VN12_22700 [Pirellula sp. SH-Sr6A]|nr:hypothetical protein VN12_22700 [Pirellula sp. SH-Sr6A]